MADEKKKTRSKNTTKDTTKNAEGKVIPLWNKSGGKAWYRGVKSVYGPEKLPVAYREYKLDKVSDPTEALTLLKLKGARAVACIVKGYNAILRQESGGDAPAIRKIAERKGLSFEDAEKQYRDFLAK